MQSCYADFSIQIRRTTPGKVVKITGSNKRTLSAILKVAAGRRLDKNMSEEYYPQHTAHLWNDVTAGSNCNQKQIGSSCCSLKK